MFTLFTPGQIVQFGLKGIPVNFKIRGPKRIELGSMVRTSPYKKLNKLVPFNWRGWWDYGTGAIGDGLSFSRSLLVF
jgi:hypothetical protein